jgi:membrane protein DedA with SNARE-associated domain
VAAGRFGARRAWLGLLLVVGLSGAGYGAGADAPETPAPRASEAPRPSAPPPPPPGGDEPPEGAWEDRLLGTLDRIDPTAGAAGRGPLSQRQQLLLGGLLAAATLISEDLTCVAAGILASHGKLSLSAATIACLIGIFVGDLLLVLVGRWLGRRIVERAPFRWVLRPQALARAERWFTAKGTRVVLASRFVPGSRLPLFLAAGVLRAPFGRIALALLLAGAVWTPILVGLSAWTGGAVIARLHSYERVALPVLFVTSAVVFVFVRIVVPLWTWRGRRMLLGRWRRLTRWEFWPAWLFELPVLLHGLWLALRHRHGTIFTSANPGIPAGGFVEESKSGILRELSKSGSAPIARYVVVDLPGEVTARLPVMEAALQGAGLGFPVVLKPDVGERGRGVAVVRSRDSLLDYLAQASGKTIAQEYVPGEEFGVFYVRHPADEHGRVISITGKRFPAVVGDGRRRLEELILADDRAVCMAPLYFEANFSRLDEVPAAGERVQLVEIGNHCRGTVFLDGREHRTPELEAAIDAIAQGFDGFHFGRFDLRVPSVEQFRAGAGWKILELNGVTSEATHIYAPGASLVAAYRTLFAQWRLAFEIGAANAARGARPTPLRGLLRLLRERRARLALVK